MKPSAKESCTSPIRLNDKGFTLVEVLIAVVLIGLGLVMYAVTSGSIMEKNADSKKESIAVTLAQDKIEHIKDLARTVNLVNANGMDSPVYSTSTQDWTPTTGGELIDSEGDTGTSQAIYTRAWTIDTLSGETNLYGTTVTVTWDGNQSVVLSSRVSQ